MANLTGKVAITYGTLHKCSRFIQFYSNAHQESHD
jgi:hypothetical protein